MIEAGLTAGIFTAIGGALKDMNFEPFEWRKFLRSPLIALGVSIFVDNTLPFYAAVAVCFLGERMITEIYKAFSDYKPGKFSKPERDRGWMVKK